MNPLVQQAVEEIRNWFVGQRVDAEVDTEGGAFVTVHDCDVGSQYERDRSWIGFHITFQYPFADVYPHFCAAGLKRKDGGALGEGLSNDATWKTPSRTESAVQISRKSNRWDSSADTAAIKLDKVLQWIRSR